MRSTSVRRAIAALFAIALSDLPAEALQAPARQNETPRATARPIPADGPFANAPVAPDAIYVARAGARTGISVVDLNGFGQSTGNPVFDPLFGPILPGTSHFPFNPNVAFQGSILVPPLAPGTTTADGGSAGVFTLTRDSDLDDLLIHRPRLAAVGDMMLGQPLDLAFNDGAPFGCNAGGGNLCASSFFQLLAVDVAASGNTLVPNTLFGTAPFHVVAGGGNPISFAPHPNPPPLLAIPLCNDPRILGLEPTSIVSTLPPPAGPGLLNLLLPSANYLGIPSIGLPPAGLLAREQNAFFVGPSPQESSGLGCQNFTLRQQIGHFLYAVDAAHDEVVVLNSNTFRAITRLAVEDPAELAMGPNLDFLAVTSRARDEVVFIDIDPRSSAFHQIVQRTTVGRAPRGVAWDPGNEDVFVCNEGDGTVSIVSAATLGVRKVLRGLDRPFAVAVTPRQDRFGSYRNVYFAYILERDGHVSLFESGPNGVNGWGFDEIIGRTSFAFDHPRAIQPDHLAVGSGVWIAHENQLDPGGNPTGLGGGAATNLVLDSPVTFPIVLVPGEVPSMRLLGFRIASSIGSDELTGIPLDLAFDDHRNLGALRNHVTPFSAGAPLAMNGKGLVREIPGGIVRNTNTPALMFLPVRRGTPGAEAIDVIDLASGLRLDTDAYQPGIQSIPAPGAMGVMDYFRQ